VQLADRLTSTAKDYEQRSAHHRERAELGDTGDGNALSELIVSEVFAGVAITLHELVKAIEEQGIGADEELAA
jgi:hypothetical protein